MESIEKKEESDREIPLSELYSYTHYLYGEAFLGSHQGMRFRLSREPLENVTFRKKEEWAKDASFLLYIWPEPFSFEKTADDDKQSFTFPFTEEGLKEAVECLNREFGNSRDRWRVAKEKRWAKEGL